jgi:hypothetical protein
MKKVLLFTLFFSVFVSFAQNSIQFSDPLPVGSPAVITTDKLHFGNYENKESGVKYHIDEKGIAIISMMVGTVTREQLRESSKIRVSGNFLFGIKANDSVPCFLEGETYYYGIEQRLAITGEGSLNTLSKISSDTYVINFHEGLYFEPSYLHFENGKMTIIHGNLSNKTAYHTILHTTTITRYGSSVVILSPSAEQWKTIQPLLFSGEQLIYVQE